MTTTHLTTSVVETHQGPHGTLEVNRVKLRRAAETARLHRLAATLGSNRTFAVTRGVINSSVKQEKAGRPRDIIEHTYLVTADSATEAAAAANEAKYTYERNLGHHRGEGGVQR